MIEAPMIEALGRLPWPGRRLLLAALAAGCAPRARLGLPTAEPRLVVGPPWQAEGAWLYPTEVPVLDETGLAVPMEPARFGRLSTNGEVIDPDAPLCAHRTLPLPSIVRVWNFDTGRAVVLRAIERGPARAGRILGLTPGALARLGGQGRGPFRVRVEALVPESRIAAAEAEAAALARAAPAAAGGTVAGDLPGAIRIRSEPLAPPAGSRTAPSRSAPPDPVPAMLRSPGPPPILPGSVFAFAPPPLSLVVSPGAFTNETAASRVSWLTAGGLAARLRRLKGSGADSVRVELGPLPDVEAADAALARLLAQGWQAAAILLVE